MTVKCLAQEHKLLDLDERALAMSSPHLPCSKHDQYSTSISNFKKTANHGVQTHNKQIKNKSVQVTGRQSK